VTWLAEWLEVVVLTVGGVAVNVMDFDDPLLVSRSVPIIVLLWH
jgi:hypothetical protein